MPVVSVDELERYMKACFDSGDRVAAEEILDGVQSALETKLGSFLTVREVTEDAKVSRYDGWSSRVFFPHRPVVAVSAVLVGGTAVDFSAQPTAPYGFSEWSLGADVHGRITVTYTTGFDASEPEHEGVRLVIKRAAAREMKARADDTQGLGRYSQEGVSVDFVAAGALFTDAEIGGLSRYRHRRFAH